jgi:hypothetical protein
MTQDQFMQISQFIFIIIIILFFLIRGFNRSKKRILVTDYCRGVHFVDGSFKAVLGPGSYKYNERKEQISIVDMRAQPVLIERLAFQDALKHEGVISIGTELLIRDPHVAATTLRDQVNDAYIVVRDTVRAVMSKQIVASEKNTPAVAEAITKAVSQELASVGIVVSEIEINELSSRPGQSRTADSTETIQ